MIVYRDIIDFSVLTVYPTVLLNVLTIVMSFIFEDFLGLCFLNDVICEYRQFYFLLSSHRLLCISFSCLIALAVTSSDVHRSGEKRCICCVPLLGGNVQDCFLFVCSTIKYDTNIPPPYFSSVLSSFTSFSPEKPHGCIWLRVSQPRYRDEAMMCCHLSGWERHLSGWLCLKVTSQGISGEGQPVVSVTAHGTRGRHWCR